MPMKISHRIAAIAAREVKRLAAIAAERTARAGSFRKPPSFRPLTEAESEAILGVELLMALSGVRAIVRAFHLCCDGLRRVSLGAGHFVL
jgi:hypothetical protein